MWISGIAYDRAHASSPKAGGIIPMQQSPSIVGPAVLPAAGNHVQSMVHDAATASGGSSRHGSAGTFTFGGQRLKLRSRTLVLNSNSPAGRPVAGNISLDARLQQAQTYHQHDAAAGMLQLPCPAAGASMQIDTPMLFRRTTAAPNQAATPTLFVKSTQSSAVDPSAKEADHCGAHTVFSNAKLVAHILQCLGGLELHEAARLGCTCRAMHAVVGQLHVTDLDFSWRGRTFEEGAESAPAIHAALSSLTALQCQAVRRLVASPDLLACPKGTLKLLAKCPNLQFLIFTLQGRADDMFAAVADHWPALAKLTSCLPALVCLDASNCLMQDHHLQAIAQHCPGLRALDLSYNPCITAHGLLPLLSACTGLEELDLSTCPAAQGPQVLAGIGQHCGQQLVSLYLEHDANWTAQASACRAAAAGASFEAAALPLMAQHCNNLQLLSLSGQEPAAASAPDNAKWLSQLLFSCTQLCSLNLQGCDKWLQLEHLQSLAAAPATLQQLQLPARLLEQQQLSKAPLPTFQGLARLETLLLDGATQGLTLSVVHALVQIAATAGLPLHLFKLVYEEWVATMQQQACPSLQELSITGNPCSALQQLQQLHPGLACNVHSTEEEELVAVADSPTGDTMPMVISPFQPATVKAVQQQEAIPMVMSPMELPAKQRPQPARSQLGSSAVMMDDRTNKLCEPAGVVAAKPAQPPQQWGALLSFLSTQAENIHL